MIKINYFPPFSYNRIHRDHSADVYGSDGAWVGASGTVQCMFDDLKAGLYKAIIAADGYVIGEDIITVEAGAQKVLDVKPYL